VWREADVAPSPAPGRCRAGDQRDRDERGDQDP
jgi:hypothetical protein